MMGDRRQLFLAGVSLLKQSDDSAFILQQCLKLENCLQKSNGLDDFQRILFEILTNPKYTLTIAKCFPNIIIEILSENIIPHLTTPEKQMLNVEKSQFHIRYCLVLGKLVSLHPDILPLSLKYFNIYPSPFEWACNDEEVPKRRRLSLELDSCSIEYSSIAECCYNFLKTAPNIFRNKWNWSAFINFFLSNNDVQIKWFLCECISILSGMSEYQQEKLRNNMIGNEETIKDFILRFDHKIDHMNYNNFDLTMDTEQVEKICRLSQYVVDIAGILLPVHNVSFKEDGSLIPVKSTLDNLRSLALAIVSGKAACLTGPVGCGKTAVVEHLAALTGRKKTHLKKIQLGDQTDSRTLLGTYRCTDIPGEFVWQPGVVTQAVQQGHWLLLEDIDCAAIDVASVLSSLLERNVLSVPGYRDSIPITPGFQLFLTKRTMNPGSGQAKSNSNVLTLLNKHWIQINIEPLSQQELITVINELFPKLKTISSRMIDVFMLFSVGDHDSSLQNVIDHEQSSHLLKTLSTKIPGVYSRQSGRLISTRDLLKWCSRAIIDFDVSSPDSALKVLQDAIDIFASSSPDNESRISLSKTIGAFLGIIETKAEYLCAIYKPAINLTPNVFQVGRASVPRKQLLLSDVHFHEKSVTFSYTRPSACLLERISCCVNMREPVLLVGETGTGKTSSIQYLAKETGHKLIVINMNQQSDSADLLGGYKPVDLKYIISPIRKEFECLFRNYFNGVKNAKFLEHISNCFYSNNWKTLLVLMKQSQMAAIRHFDNSIDKKGSNGNKRKSDNGNSNSSSLKNDWLKFGKKLEKLELQIKTQASLAFSFIEGSLINALKEGHWVLLDEINLASAETLECLSGLLEDQNNSISLIERGDNEPIIRHKDFTLFACMNPATDVGKRDLPVGLRNRFTEFFVDELTEKNDLLLLINDYLKNMSIDQNIIQAIYKFYLSIREESKLNLLDGTGQSPHYSLRTLCRALAAAPNAFCGTITRSLYETMCLSFLTQLDSSSHPKVQNMIAKAILGKKPLKSVTQTPIPMPKTNNQEVFINVEGYWIWQGNLKPEVPENYILTSSIRKNLKDLVRIISLGKLPILLQGDTSVGKTSLITYLAKITGNHCVRINNHQHTDLQEYIGSYASDPSGKLIFKEGVLVEAMRKGYWIILDELNLAPSDVLEALNRVLDDNKELFIPETQQVIKADSKFILFATQNPPGLYGGRKLLSRAFRNRFVELHFDEIPKNELEVILHQRCHMPLSYCKKVLSVMTELQVRRRGSAAIQGKEGFITLRDLFRWGERYKIASNHDTLIGKYYDWDQHIADEGYLVLAGRVRQADERLIIQQVLEKHIKRKVEPENLFSLHKNTSPVIRPILEEILNSKLKEFNHIVWTFNMRRLAVLVAKCFYFKEPVLLVGETGCGKTTVCQVLSAVRSCKLTSINCHMHTESSDFLGGLRPVRTHDEDGKLFEWVDGPLTESMKTGGIFLADEISLADDSVLERLNSLLEPERQIYLAEKGISMEGDLANIISAVDDFRFIGTMNPGGDYGKKELSPALRNRFTEIWCDHITSREDLIMVLQKSLHNSIYNNIEKFDISSSIIDFVEWFKKTRIGDRFPCTIRDLLSWVHFMNETIENHQIKLYHSYLHGASLVFLDCLGTSFSGSETEEELLKIKSEAFNFLLNQFKTNKTIEMDDIKNMILPQKNFKFEISKKNNKFGFDPFYIECGKHIANNIHKEINAFNFMVPTTGLNTLRILRGLQLKKPILLEGSPGVGKTSLVTALAKSLGHNILRINLSDQTDISDLFGADLPTPEGSFAWKDGAFLTALQNGDWILLDELNLAPQPVLEGLNACLDHRGEIFIPELCKTFYIKHETRIFACQNPLRQGGARRGLPKSFLNRFTQVYIDTLTSADLLFISQSQYSFMPSELLSMIINFNSRILKETSDHLWGYRGSPWELNLRDIQRWCDGIKYDFYSNCNELTSFKAGKYAKLLYVDRMRALEDKEHVKRIYKDIFGDQYPMNEERPVFHITKNTIHIGDTFMKRNLTGMNKNSCIDKKLLILRSQLPVLKSLIQCVQMNWLAIVIGPTSSGKSSCIQTIAQLLGVELYILPVTSAMDTSDILGGFEQADYNRHLEEIQNEVENILMISVQSLILKNNTAEIISVMKEWEVIKSLNVHDLGTHQTIEKETISFMNKLEKLNVINQSLKKVNTHNSMITEKICKINEKIQHFAKLVKKENTINSGGKFEWIDSLLIKCLLNGSWLLVDNVNLCSSAVLDRLNGLLEPNGVLTIPERGDTLNVIKPHPDFRMFFTMDPKNGEISRAMRNRGVEIYIIGSEESSNESFTDFIPLLDLHALLKSSGLPTTCFNIFLSCHKEMCAFYPKYDQPTQYNLLQTAFLTYQQICRGESIGNAIINSFSDIYIKSHITTDIDSNNSIIADSKNMMLKKLKEDVKSFIIHEKSLNYNLDINTEHTFSCFGLSKCAQLEKIKQDCFFLSLALNKKCYDLFTIYKMMYYIYKSSSYDDTILRHKFLKSMISSIRNLKDAKTSCLKLNDALFKTTLLAIENHHVEYPWSLESLTEINIQKDKDDINLINKLCGHLYFLTTLSQREITQSVNNEIMTILQYSKNVLNGDLSDEYVDFPLLKNSLKLLNEMDKLIINIFNDSNTEISYEEWPELITTLSWLNRFHKISCKSLFENILVNTKTKRIMNEDALNTLVLHYKWLWKLLFHPLQKLHNSHLSMAELNHLTMKINKSIASSNSPFKSVCKHLKKRLGEPLLYPTEEVYLLCLKRDKDINNSVVFKFLSHKFDQNDVLRKNKDRALQLSIENIFGYPKIDPIDITNSSEEIIDLDETNTELEANLDWSNTINSFQYSSQLWPIQDSLMRKIWNILKNKLFAEFLHSFNDYNSIPETTDVSKYLPLLNNLLPIINSIEFIPPKLKFLGSISEYIKENNPEIVSSLKPHSMEIWNLMSEYQEISPSLTSPFWLNLDMFKNIDVDNSLVERKEEMVPINFPHMMYNTIKLTMAANTVKENESGITSASLCGWKYRSQQLLSLQDFLWKNIMVSSSPELNQLYLDAQTIVINFERFVINLEDALLRKHTIKNNAIANNGLESNFISNSVNKCIDHINKLYKDENKHFTVEMIVSKNIFNENLSECLKIYYALVEKLEASKGNVELLEKLCNNDEFDFMILIGRLWSLFSVCNISIFSEIGTVDIVAKDQLKMNYMNEDIALLESFLDLKIMQNLLQGTIHVPNDEVNSILDYNNFGKNQEKIIDIIDKDVHYKKIKNGDVRSEFLYERRSLIINKIDKMAKGKIYRPNEPTYLDLSREFSYFINTLGNAKIMMDHYKGMYSSYKKMADIIENQQVTDNSKETLSNSNIVIKKYHVWKYSVKNFYRKLSNTFSQTFPDIVKPFMNYITQVVYGLDILQDCLMKMIFTIKYGMCNTMLINNYAETLVRFPILNKNCQNNLDIVDSISSVNFMNFLTKINSSREVERPDLEKKEMYSLLKINLQEIYCKVVMEDSIETNTWSLFNSVLEELVTLWQKQQEAIEKQKQDEDLLYVTKTKCDDLSQEEQFEAELDNMFPSFIDTDFSDFKPIVSNNKVQKTKENPKKEWEQYFTERDVELITSIHSNIVQNFTLAEWLPKSSGNKLPCDHISPLIERYKILSSFLDDIPHGLKESLDSQTLSSLVILVAHVRSLVDGEDYLENKNNVICETDNKPNFYLSPWVQESKRCLPTLESIKIKTLMLLEQWPDFPTLKDIIMVIDRIMGFPVTSPVARFLTGLELLRDKMEEWNKNSHKGNNLNDLTIVIAQQIVSWRKLELSGWKDSLNNTYNSMKLKANKWWFHVYTLVNSFIYEKSIDDNTKASYSIDIGNKSDQKPMKSSEFVTAMQQFMEKSPLVEFKMRLNILHVFHCHAIHMQTSKRRDELICVLWNIYKYYSQYSAHITQVIKDKRAPIEKKLREFVKICTWERDLSYWSVKDLVYKSQKTLHKHNKEFEEVLKMPVSSFLVCEKSDDKISKAVGLWDRPKRTKTVKQTNHCLVDLNSYSITTRFLKKYIQENDVEIQSIDSSLVKRLESLTTKAKDLCKITISKSAYPQLIHTLDGVTTQIIDSITYLKSLEVSSSLPKEKQKSLAKSQLQQKRKGLSDLFRTLSQVGISFKTGLVENSIRHGDILNFKIAPVDFESAFSYLKNKRCDTTLLSFWQDCEFYHQRCIARMGNLNSALLSPAADLGPPNIERIKGYASHYMLLVQEQKLKISKYSRKLCQLRHHIGQIGDICEVYSPLPEQSILFQYLNNLNDIYSMVVITMQQFGLLLKAYPNADSFEDKSINNIKFDNALQNNCVSGLYKEDPAWNDLNTKVKNIITIAQKQKDCLNNVYSILPSTFAHSKKSKDKNELIICQSHVDIMKMALKNLGDIEIQVSNVISKFNISFENGSILKNPIVCSMMNLNVHMKTVIAQLEPCLKKNDSCADDENMRLIYFNSTEEFSAQVEKLINDILLSVQTIYKKWALEDVSPKPNTQSNGTNVDDVDNSTSDGEQDESIKESHLKKEILENISDSLVDFHMSQLNDKIGMLTSKLDGIMQDEMVSSKKHLLKCLPLLEQISLFAQFFITQQVSAYRVSCKMLSIILNIFTELCQKGFCTPSDAGEEAGEEKGQGKLAGGTGLADGEGEKDVSDQIENQDQLEDAHKAGEEKNKDDDKDCKEEAAGIEMTDDFESHLQDVDEKEGSDNESDDEDVEKQMGETEEGGDKLDEQLWGSDDEDDVENNDSKKEEKGPGVPLNEKNLEAKADDADSGSEEGNENEKKKKNKEDINEMDEPDYDDDQIDPYHGNQKPLPEPEPMELPDDTNINENEDGEQDEEQEDDSKNPFEIDIMKEKKSKEEEIDKKEESNEKDSEKPEINNEKNIEGSSDEDDEPNEDHEGEDAKEEKSDIENPDEVKEDEENDGSPEDEKNNEAEESPENENDVQPEIPKNQTVDEQQIDEEQTAEEQHENDAIEHPDNKPSSEDNVENEEIAKGSKDTVQTNPLIDKNEEAAPFEQSQEQAGDDNDGFGQSELSEDQRGHKGTRKDKPQSSNDKNNPDSEKRSDKRNKPGDINEDRILGEIKEPVQKKMKTLNLQNNDQQQDEEEEGVGENSEQQEADLYQHIKQATKNDSQVIDAATKEQAEKQPVPNKPDEEADSPDPEVNMEVDDTDDLEIVDEPNKKIEPEKCGKDQKKNETKSNKGDLQNEDITSEMAVDVDGENVLTLGAERGSETIYQTKLDMLQTSHGNFEKSTISETTINDALQSIGPDRSSKEDNVAWQSLWRRTSMQARLLTEKLRLVLEPTGLSRLAGDYRTGKRINMRKVIPYIASHFRKDRIWLRRTKPARREYQIAVAIDDSSSMSDNQSKELAFESLALISQALNFLEAGDLAVLSFGESTKILHPFNDQFTETSGSKLIQNLTFKQTKTRIAQMLEFTSVMFEKLCYSNNSPNAKLLLIVSDGRGIFSEGETKVLQTVRKVRQQGIFMVYLIIDNPANQTSIMDIRVPVFEPDTGAFKHVQPYLDSFPFPFYLILRDITALPSVLSDAMRQWFELAANMDKH